MAAHGPRSSLRIPLRKLSALALAAVGLLSSRPDALAGPDPIAGRAGQASLRERLTAWSRTFPDGPRSSQSPTRAAALQDLSGASSLRCATPILLAMHQNESKLSRRSRALLDAATRVGTALPGAVRLSPGGEFRIHYWTDPSSPDRVDARDSNLDGVPDGVERLAAELSEVVAEFVHELDWAPLPAPPAGRNSPIVDVYLVGLEGPSAGAGGFTLPLATPSTESAVPGPEEPEGAASTIFLDAGLASIQSAPRSAVAHQVAHVIQMRESVREAAWWHEASAAWLEDRLAGTGPELAGSMTASTGRRGAGLDEDLLGLGLETFLWPHYLMESTGGDADLLRRIWEEMSAVPGENTFEAMDRVLRRRLSTSLAEEVKVFHVWNLFGGQADDGRHYRFGGSLPTPLGDAIYDAFPARGGSPGGPLAPLGSAILRLLGDGSRGGLSVHFFGGGGGLWELTLLVYSADSPSQVRHVPIAVDEAGRGTISFPWKNLAGMDLLVHNLVDPGAPAADYAFSIDYEPTIPFDLLSLTASPTTGGVTVAWSTESEQGLAGWNILRGAGILGPFSRINTYLLPGAGRAQQPMSYVFLDSAVEPGQKYYYHLEGVTFEGFTEDSHTAGVRLGGRSARRSLR